MGLIAMVYTTDPDQMRRLRTVVEGGDVGKMVGIYMLPKSGEVPTCAGTCSKTERKLNGWGRHPSGGYLVHACGRRHRDWRRRIATSLLDTLGINRIPRAETPLMFQNPPGWGR